MRSIVEYEKRRKWLANFLEVGILDLDKVVLRLTKQFVRTRQQYAIVHYYAIGFEDFMTDKEIGEHFGMGISKAFQLRKAALDELKFLADQEAAAAAQASPSR